MVRVAPCRRAHWSSGRAGVPSFMRLPAQWVWTRVRSDNYFGSRPSLLINANHRAMPGPFYARYVPPKASTASSPVTPKKASPPPPSSPDLAPEKREKRSNKRKRTDANDAAGNADDAALKKHRSVLSKFAKSTKIAERLKTREQPDEENELDEEPELHGKLRLPGISNTGANIWQTWCLCLSPSPSPKAHTNPSSHRYRPGSPTLLLHRQTQRSLSTSSISTQD